MHQITMQQPSDNHPDGEKKKHQQRAGHGQGPEQEADVDYGDVLDCEENRKAGQDQAYNQFEVHIDSDDRSYFYQSPLANEPREQ
jgi:hypothetical protein